MAEIENEKEQKEVIKDISIHRHSIIVSFYRKSSAS